MSMYAKKTSRKFEPAPAGMHQAVCCDVVDLGTQKTNFGDKAMLKFVWQLSEQTKEHGRFLVSKRYTNSSHEKAGLWKGLASWLGRTFTDAEREGFDLEQLIGENCQLVIIHKKGDDGKTYAQVQTIVPSNNEEQLTVENYIRVIDRPKNAA